MMPALIVLAPPTNDTKAHEPCILRSRWTELRAWFERLRAFDVIAWDSGPFRCSRSIVESSLRP
jgi:hypothetical protein